MKSKLNRHYSLIASILLSLALIFSGQALAGNVEVTLPDTNGTSAFQVNDSSSNVLMKVQSNGNFSLGKTGPGNIQGVPGVGFLLTGDTDISGDLDAGKLYIKEGGDQSMINGGLNVAGGLYVTGDTAITGTLSKGGGSFKIDHPLDPQNKYLYHSFVESPDMKNVYDGVVVLNDDGEAWVEFPEWMEALNRDFRYQLTCIGDYAPVYIAQKILGNRFKIAGGTPGLEVSWQVTGTRQDPYAEAHRIPVEQDKPERERGTYLYPDVYKQSE